MLIHGKCHCGNLSFALDWPAQAESIPARACDCTFCMRHGNVWTSHPQARLRIAIADPAALSRYAFATATADFLVCSRCGVVVCATSRIDERLYAVVNVNTFVDVEAGVLAPPSPSSLDAESTEQRLARRKRNWIADVALQTP